MTKVFVDISAIEQDIIINRLEYTLKFIQNHPCAPKDILWITENDNTHITVGYGVNIGDYSVPYVPFCFNKEDMPLPYHKSLILNGMTIYGFGPEENEGFGFDIFQTIFYHISRYEEWYLPSNQIDTHGMMRSELQFLVKNGLHDSPVVDHLIYAFYLYLGMQPLKIETQYSLTHDIDAIRRLPSFYKFLRAIANTILYQKQKLKTLGRLFNTYLGVLTKKQADPYDTFSWLLTTSNPKIQDRYIYFLSGGRTEYENLYRIQDPKCLAIYALAQKEGYIFGIHPSYLAGDNLEMTQKEKTRLENVLGQEVSHSRQHFLRYHIPHTGQIIEDLGIETESSFGYRNKTGFRCGTGFPYHMYEFNEERPYKFLERPLIVMDMAIIHEVGWNAQKVIELLDAFIEKNQYYTHITFNFHNSTFDPILFDADYLIAYYKKLLGST